MPGFPWDSAALLVQAGDVVVRATVVLVGALLLSLLFRRSGAAARHALWTVTLGGLVVLPVLSPLLPTIPLPLPWSPAGAGVGATAQAGTTGGEPFLGAGAPDDLSSLRAGVADPVVLATGGPGEARAASRDGTPGAAAPVGEVGGRRIGPGALLGSWLLGASVLAFFLGMGLRRAGRLFRGAERARGEAWARSLERARRAVGLRRQASLVLSPAARTALAGGFVRPVVLLPESARAWSTERRDLVLLHEMVHLKRSDPLRQVIGRLAMTLYWFHPLAWLAVREATLAREQACDEAVLALGHCPTTYARHLVDLAEPDPLPLPAIARVDRPPLEKRIMAILEPRSRRSSAAAVTAALVGTAWALTAAAVAPAEWEGPAATDGASASFVQVAYPGGQALPGKPAFQPEPALPEAPAESPAPESPAPERPAAAPDPEAPPAAPEPGTPAVAPANPPTDPGRGCRLRGDGMNFADGMDFEDGPPGPGDRFIQSSLGPNMLCLRTHGDVQLEDGGTRVASIAPEAWLVLAVLGEGRVQRMEITPGPRGPEHAWFVDGEPRPFDDEARTWRDAMLTVLGGRMGIANIRAAAGRLQGEIGRAQADEARLRREVTRVRSELARFETELARPQTEEARFRSEIASIRAVEARLGAEAARIRSEQFRGQGELVHIKARVGALETAARVTEDAETRARLAAEAEALRVRMDEVEQDLPAEVAAALQEVEERIEAHRRAAQPRIRELEARIEALVEARREEAAPDLVERRREVESRIAEITGSIEALGVAPRVRELERRIEELDADRKVREIEARQASERETLLRLIREIP